MYYFSAYMGKINYELQLAECMFNLMLHLMLLGVAICYCQAENLTYHYYSGTTQNIINSILCSNLSKQGR